MVARERADRVGQRARERERELEQVAGRAGKGHLVTVKLAMETSTLPPNVLTIEAELRKCAIPRKSRY
jgi:hypothetical protein